MRRWIRTHVRLPPQQEVALLQNVERVLKHNEQLWEQSKREALEAVTKGCAAKTALMREQLYARDATVSSIARYFEALIAELTDRANRDPKTRLLHGGRFIDQLEAFLSVEQRGRWCAVGLVDIRSFKSYNDSFGHIVGDRIIERLAMLLAEQIRPDDVIAQEASPSGGLHARFGGDEFCFLIPHLDDPGAASIIAERFRRAVQAHDWAAVDERLRAYPVVVDVGVASLLLGPVGERRARSRDLAHELLARADRLMYQAKVAGAEHAMHCQLRIEHEHMVEVVPPGPAGA